MVWQLDIRLYKNWNLHANTILSQAMLMLLTLIIWEQSITMIILCTVRCDMS